MLSTRRFVLLAVTVTPTMISLIAEAADRPSSAMPLRSVRLYETGVGYFERTGRLSGSGGVSLPVPAGHLDDALKTLVVLGADGATQVSGIEFASSTTRDRAGSLAGLPTAEGENREPAPAAARSITPEVTTVTATVVGHPMLTTPFLRTLFCRRCDPREDTIGMKALIS